jgi:hypothetical protein
MRGGEVLAPSQDTARQTARTDSFHEEPEVEAEARNPYRARVMFVTL